MFVKPKKGLKVRDPVTKGFLPEDGSIVPNSLYWTRRLRDGDVVETTPSPADAPAGPAKAAPTPVVAKEESSK